MSKAELTVAITGLNAIDSPGPGLAVIRALRKSREFRIRIIGLSYDSLEPGIYMHDLVDKSFQIPFPSAGTASLMTRLEYINSVEKIDVLIPNFDAELFSFIKIADSLEEKFGIKMFLPTLEQFEARQKTGLYSFGLTHGIKVPYSKAIYSVGEIATLPYEFRYPLVVKGQYYDASVAHSAEQAVSYFNKISSKWGLPIIIQEYVRGTEVNVTALGDGTGKMIGAVPMRKQYITDKGKAWAGISLDDDTLTDITRKLISSTKWRGCLELEFIKTNEGIHYLLEINPRFPAWIYLAVGCGQNHPEALLKLALGRKVRTFPKHEAGKMFIRYSYDMIIDLHEFEKISTSGEL
jgi:carbamoyl-phosphate synthase large subunit